MCSMDEVIILTKLPANDTDKEINAWLVDVTTVIDATVKEHECSADLWSWRLAILGKHWLLHYSSLCEAAWLLPLEGTEQWVEERIRDL